MALLSWCIRVVKAIKLAFFHNTVYNRILNVKGVNDAENCHAGL